MKSDRRRIVQGLGAGWLAGLVGCGRAQEQQMTTAGQADSGSGSKTILILGGTGFVGPFVVRRALERGYTPTLFNRGRTSLEIFPDLELLTGDRNGEIGSIRAEVLAGRRWDAVVDLSGFTGPTVRDTAELLADATEHYVFMSSVAAYESFASANNESSPLHAWWKIWNVGYGPYKARAEREARIAMDGRVTNIRPTIIAGPEDSRDRLTYWPARVARGGEMLIPGPPDTPVQFVDVRDVADFTIHCAEQRLAGNFNVVIPPGSYTMQQLISDCRAVTGGQIDATWVSPEFVDNQGIDPEDSLPLWDSPLGDRRAFSLIEAPQGFANGLRTRPPLETLRDTYEWWQDQTASRRSSLRAGIEAEAEAALLRAWHESNAAA